MTDITLREQKIQDKRKQTEWKDFVKDICSWFPLVLYKNNGITSKFPPNDRTQNIRKTSDFDASKDGLLGNGVDYIPQQSFFVQYAQLFKHI